MQKFLNTLLLIIFLVLVALFAYKTLSTPEVVKAPVIEHIEEIKPAQNNDAAVKTEPNANVPSSSSEGVDKQIHDYIIAHPEVLVESIEGMQKKKIEESDKQATNYLLQNKTFIEEEGTPPVLGNKDGDINIVVFYDYNCSFCKQANEFTNEIIQKDPQVKVTLRPIPILGGTSMYVAKVALAVNKIAEEKFWSIHNEMMKMKPITEEGIKALLAANQIDYAMVENELNSFSVKQLIAKNFDFAKNLGVKGAPSYVINGVFIPGMIDTEKFVAIISELRQISTQTKEQEPMIHTPEDAAKEPANTTPEPAVAPSDSNDGPAQKDIE